MKRVLVAMSGGVDSSAAALLLKEEGWEVAGVTMCLGVKTDGQSPKKSCCGPDAVADARRAAESIGMPHWVLDFGDELEAGVIAPFVDRYRSGLTPNPCVDCNRNLKFGSLLGRARALGFDKLATGHYAGIVEANGGRRLMRPRDRGKDQTYFLASIRREALSSIVFPLAGYLKEEVRTIARKAGLPTAERPESQDICFVPDNDYGRLIAERIPDIAPGPIVDVDGNVLGRHRGIPFYTVGQRGGLGITGPRPLYVVMIDADKNTIVVGTRRDLASDGLVCTDFNRLVDDIPDTATVKIRHTRREALCRVTQHDETTLSVFFDEPQDAVTPGQAVVLYRDDVVLGGGTISRALGRGKECPVS